MRHFINIVTDFNSKKILNENLEIKKAINAYGKAAELSPAQQTISSKTTKLPVTKKGADFTQQILDLKKRISDFFSSSNQKTIVEPTQRSSPENDALKVLGLSSNATPMQIKMRYKQLAKKFHPDLVGSNKSLENEMKRITRAYNQLKPLLVKK